MAGCFSNAVRPDGLPVAKTGDVSSVARPFERRVRRSLTLVMQVGRRRRLRMKTVNTTGSHLIDNDGQPAGKIGLTHETEFSGLIVNSMVLSRAA